MLLSASGRPEENQPRPEKTKLGMLYSECGTVYTRSRLRGGGGGGGQRPQLGALRPPFGGAAPTWGAAHPDTWGTALPTRGAAPLAVLTSAREQDSGLVELDFLFLLALISSYLAVCSSSHGLLKVG